jgi:hypothetical protein
MRQIVDFMRKYLYLGITVRFEEPKYTSEVDTTT